MSNTQNLVSLVVLLVLLFGLIMPLRLSWRSKTILSLLVILGISRNYLHLIVGGNPFDPDIPYNLNFVLDLSRTTLITLAGLVVFRSLLNLGAKIIKRSYKAFVLPAFSLFHAQLMLILALAVACYGTSTAYSKPRINHYQVTMERLDPRLDGMRVIMVSDFHITTTTDPSYVGDIVNKINSLNPDLILLPGDLIDGQVNKRDAVTKLLFNLKAKFGVYLTTGNHEYYSGYQSWHDYFVKGGIMSLDNKVVALQDDKNKTLLTLGGITDPKAANYGLPMPDVKGVAQALDDSAPTIVLSHRPAYAIDFAHSDKKVDLVLSGHTHGGLILGLNQVVAKINEGFLSGHYRINNTDLIVSNGIAVWSGYSMRLGVPNEFIVMTLRSKTKPTKDTINITRRADLQRELLAKQQAQAQAKAQAMAQGQVQGQGQNPAQAQANQVKAGSMVLTANSQSNNQAQAQAQGKTQSQDLAKTKEPKVNLDGAYGGTLSGEIKTKTGSISGINLILPMVDTESGKTYQSITNLALLPDDISADQRERIIAILKEGPQSNKEDSEKPLEQCVVAPNKTSTLPDGIKLVVLKPGPNDKHDQELLQNSNAKTAPAITITSPKSNSTQGKQVPTAANKEQSVYLSTEELIAKEQQAEDVTAEIQTEYAISLGNSQEKIDDKAVKDLLQKQQK